MNKIYRTLFVLLIFITVPYLGSVKASPFVCGERSEVIKTLAKAYKENPTAMGLASGGGMLEVFSSPSGSWTIVVTQPTGTSCIVATGDGWEAITPHVADTST
ncbi:MAG: hypothetical protein OQK35_05635 [Alphaproteobacteria bacterium]|nr:hypothetical protein [Rhodospirillales bacterium]MCW9045796.1 hypothetical protein [Alphaproteobacteria bacterium]